MRGGSAGDRDSVSGQWRDMSRQLGECFGGCFGAVSRSASNLPLCTRVLICLFTSVHVSLAVAGVSPTAVCSGGAEVLDWRQYYRVITAPATHAGFLHLLVNMLATWSILGGLLGTGYERVIGTPETAALVTVYAVAVQTTALAVAALFHYAFHVDDFAGIVGWNTCALGISGALFAFVSRSSVHRGVHVPCCGLMVPPAVYPFVLLLFVSFMWTGVFFLGHLIGVLYGFAVEPRTVRELVWVMRKVCSVTGADRTACYASGGAGFHTVAASSLLGGGAGGGRQTGWGPGRTLGSSDGGSASQQRSRTYPPDERSPLVTRDPEAPAAPPRAFPGQGRVLGGE
eukprot:TRINITY_DN8240_c0_g1_i1.p1 TRINITY_DN8240_c0_g1~~TRINITY_DN8240_c0_g1_i1.p1  ORF type:complete len:363 (+),score=110.90 TRINITY_DN8240_c0_g1_i1:64-1089(+)